MALGQYLLDQMQVLDNELLLQPAEPMVVRALIALNMAQDLFESIIAQQPNLFGDTTGTVAVVNGAESSVYPATLLRLDKLWMIDPASSRPAYPLDKIDMVGGQAANRRWPAYFASGAGTGRVDRYWADGRNIYWGPIPSQNDTVRWYGFTPAADITAAGTFAYPDMAMMPIAGFAVKLMRAGVGDDTIDLNEATAAFSPVVKQLANFNRDRAPRFIYSERHIT